MSRRQLFFGLVFLSGVAALAGATPPTRKALIFGNDGYPAKPLTNARNDARSMAEALSALNYLTVLQLDTDRKTMEASIASFAEGVHFGDLVLLYYSGHGFQIEGENYLVPVDFAIGTISDAKRQGVSLSSILQEFSNHGASVQIVILDACRDNPFLPSRSVRSGWAGLDSSGGIYLAFGTSPGSVASDVSTEPHGLFTDALLRELATTSGTIDQLFERVRQDVVRQSDGLQIPWTASSLTSSLHIDPSQDARAFNPNGADVLRFGSGMPSEASAGRSLTDTVGLAMSQSAAARAGVERSAPILLHGALDLATAGDYDDAIRSLSGVLAADPHSAIAYRLLGLLFHLLGRSDEAVTALDRAIANDASDYKAYYYRCLTDVVKDPLSAVRDCGASIALNPNFADGHVGLANAMLSVGNTARAYTEANTAITLDPKLALAYAMRGKVAAASGDPASATLDYRTASELNQGPLP
jgi:tetratricopeptide (TPR) repeat protein